MFRRPLDLKSDQMMSPQEALFYKRVLFLYGPLFAFPHRSDMFSPFSLVDSLWMLDALSHDPIYLVIDSPGGSVSAGLNLLDMMQLVKSPIVTVGRNCYSMAAIILAAGAKGRRLVYPHSSVMLHLPTAQTPEKIDPLQLQKEADEFTRVKNELVDILIDCGAKGTVKSKSRRKEILKDMDRVFYLTAKDAVNYGLADKIVEPGDMDLGPFPASLIPDVFSPLGSGPSSEAPVGVPRDPGVSIGHGRRAGA